MKRTIEQLINYELVDIDLQVKNAERTCSKFFDQMPPEYDKFLTAKSLEGLTKRSVNHYAYILKVFFKNVKKSVPSITVEDVREFLQKRSRDISDRSLENYRTIINSFFTWCVYEGIVLINPMDRIPNIKFLKTKMEALSEDELELVRKNCITVRERAVVEFLYSTGCRVSEAVEVKISDVDLRGRVVYINCGKGKKYRKVYLNSKAALSIVDYLDSRNDNSPYLFITAKRPYRSVSADTIETILRMIGDRCEPKVRLYPHKMRHTMATIAIDHGMPAVDVQTILGHTSLETTMQYVTMNDANVRYHHQKFVV